MQIRKSANGAFWFIAMLCCAIAICSGLVFIHHTPAEATTSRKDLLVYVSDANIPKVTDEHLKMIDQFVIHFGRIASDGQLTTAGLDNMKNASNLARIRSVNPNIRIILSIGGGNTAATNEFSTMAADPAKRQVFVASVVQAIRQYGLDGIDINWEYPRGSQQAILISLLSELRANIDQAATADSKKYTLTMTGSANKWFTDQNRLGEYHQYLDQISIVTYDMRGFGSFNTYTGHHAGLYTSPNDPLDQSANTTVQNYLAAGVPADKLSIGAAFYSRRFAGIADVNNGLFQPSDPTRDRGGYHRAYNVLEQDFINKNGYVRYWDDESKAAYLYNPATQEFITYDDPEAVKIKAEYVQQNNLRGMILWSYAGDYPNNPIISQMDAVLHPVNKTQNAPSQSNNTPAAPTPAQSTESSADPNTSGELAATGANVSIGIASALALIVCAFIPLIRRRSKN